MIGSPNHQASKDADKKHHAKNGDGVIQWVNVEDHL
jgi:hypothetical protein